MIIGGCILGIMSFIYRFNMHKIPPMQFFFTELFFIFIINYFVIRDAGVKPYVKEEDQTPTKIASFMGLISLITFCYSLKYLIIEDALSILYFVFIIAIIIDIT